MPVRWARGRLAAAAVVAVTGVAAAGLRSQAGQGADPPGIGAFRELGPGAPLRESEAAKHFRLRAVASHTQVTPGQAFHVALICDLADGWVYYSPDPGPVVLAGSLSVQAGPFQAGPTLWPADEAKTTDYGQGPVVNHVYKHRFVLYAPLTAAADAKPGEYAVRVSPRGQICLDVCVNLEGPGELWAEAKVKVGGQAAANPDWEAKLAGGLKGATTAEALKQAHASSAASRPAAPRTAPAASQAPEYTLWGGIGLALLAGLTLNIMPCVLPIIPLRIYSLVNMAGQSRRRYVTLGMAFAAGIVLFFVGLAGVSVAVKLVARRTIDLNFYFQFPWARILIAMVLLALSANLWGLYNVTADRRFAVYLAAVVNSLIVISIAVYLALRGVSLVWVALFILAEETPFLLLMRRLLRRRPVTGAPRSERPSQSHAAAVGMGAMMAVLSLPCSFAIMALALAWAQLQPLWLGTLAIVLIGVGMAAPHVLLASFPKLVDVLPRPGVWMEHFKQTMGFLLLPAVLYLLYTLPDRGGYPFLVAAFGAVLVFGLWMWGSWVRYDAPARKKLTVRGVATALVVAAGVLLLPAPALPAVEFEAFDAARIAEARKDHVVVVKVTAAWCTECKILEYQVFDRPETAAAFRRHNVVAVKADVADRARPDSRWVEQNLGGAPPMTILYPRGGGPPRVMVGRFSRAELFAALDEAARPPASDR